MSLTLLGSGWHARIARVLAELELQEAARAIAVPQLARLLDLVVEWNARIDLTAARDGDELVDLFVADAALLTRESLRLRTAASEPEGWVDVGSGAGAPALALAMLRPDLAVTLVEPRAKRVAFLRTAIGVLGLERVRVERSRAEDLRLPAFSVASSRATLPPAEWLALGAGLASSVWVLLAKGDPPALDGWQVAADVAYRWPLGGNARRALCFVRSSVVS
jgi:16S rRNA (guanine527-N7)-methyltransferase